MRAGDLRHKIVVQKLSTTKSGTGELVESWSEHATRRATVEPLKGREFFDARQIAAEVTTRIRLRHLDGITAKMRILAPKKRTTLAASIDNSQTTMTVASAAAFPADEHRVRVGTEIMVVTAGFGTTSWTVTRGADGTTAAAHGSGDGVRHLAVHDVYAVVNPESRNREAHLMTSERV